MGASLKQLFLLVKKHKIPVLSLFGLLVVYISVNFMLLMKLNQLPSPIYGGDLFYQLGCVNHMYYGGNWFDNCNLLSPNPGYFPLYGILVSLIAHIFFTTPFEAMLLSSYFFLGAGITLTFILTYKIFNGNTLFSVLSVLLFFSSAQPILKYTALATYVLVPVMLLSSYLFFKKRSYLYATMLGAALGFGALTHSVFFPFSFAYLGVISLLILIDFFEHFSFSAPLSTLLSSVNKDLKRKIITLVLLWFSFLALASFYWAGPLLGGAQVSEHYLEWNGPGDMNNPALQQKIATKILTSHFFKFTNLSSTIATIGSILGIFFLAVVKFNPKKRLFLSTSIIVLFLMIFSFYITLPVLGIHFVPNYMDSVFTLIGLLLALYGLFCLLENIKPLFSFKKITLATIVSVIIILILANTYVSSISSYQESVWYKQGQNYPPPTLVEAADYLIENTEVNDVVLTTKEIGFGLNALSGRKLVAGRRAQNDAFENMDIREQDAALMFYGNNSALTKSLLEKYSVSYVYFQFDWASSEFVISSTGIVENKFDPLMTFYDEQVVSTFAANNVSSITINAHVDPSLQSEFHPTFDLLVVDWTNYRSLEQPWSDELHQYLTPVWSFSEDNSLAKLYKVDTTK